MTNRAYLVAFGTVAAIAFGALVLYTVSTKSGDEMDIGEIRAFMQKKERADLLHQAYDVDGAIAAYRELAEDAPNAFYRGKMLAYLAFDLYRRGNPGDAEEAMRIYKSIINDYTIPTYSRALVFGDIASLALSNETFVRANLNQEPFNSFLPRLGEAFDPIDFAMRLNDYSDDIYPNMAAKMGNAFLLASQAGGGRIAQADMEAVQKRIQEYVEEADALRGDIEYEPGHLAEIYLERAIALQSNGRFLGTPSFEDREQAFEDALDAAERANDPRSLIARGKIRFFYAAFLLRFAEEDRSTDAKAQLQALIEGPEGREPVFQEYLLAFRDRPQTYVHQAVLSLRTASPEFRSYLSVLGWN